MIVYSLPARFMLVAQSPAPIVLPLSSRLPADLAGVEGFLYGGVDALADGVTFVIHVEAQAAELFSEPHSVPTAAASSSALWAPLSEASGNYVAIWFGSGM